MRKILELGPKQFLSGIAPSAQLENKGLFLAAAGISPFGSIFAGNSTVGILQNGPAPTDLTGNVVVDVPWSWAVDSNASTKRFYSWGDAGNLYRIDISGDNNPTNIASGSTVSNPAAGIAIKQAAGGTKYLLYWQLTQIGRWDPTAAWATKTDNWKTGLQSTPWHTPHDFQDRTYFPNGRYIGYVYDAGGGNLDVVLDALDVNANERVNCLGNDGAYLVAGITTNISSDSLTRGHTRIIFWDTNQASWQREWEIPDAAVLSIHKVGTMMKAVTTRGVFKFSFDYEPVPDLGYLSTALTPSYSYPTAQAVDVFSQALVIGGDTRLSTLGKVLPDVPSAFHQPFAGFTGVASMVAASAKTNDIFVGTTSSKLYRVKWSDTPGTGAAAQTIFIDLQRWWQIGRIVLHFDDQFASGDSFAVSVSPDAGTPLSSWGAVTYADSGAIRNKELYGTLEARRLQLQLTFTAGAVKLRGIEVWGDPIEVPTHTRS